MSRDEIKDFVVLWSSACEVAVNSKQLSRPALNMIFEALEAYPLSIISQALQEHCKQNKFAPTPADIIEIIKDFTQTKHVGADEAWSIALESFDEYSTVAWTKEIAEARSIAGDVYYSGDKVAARMVFKDAYLRIIKTSSVPVWMVSAGFDCARRMDAIKAAVQLGRLPTGSESRYLIDPPKMTVAGLIESANKHTGGIGKQAALDGIKSMLGVVNDDGIARREKERQEFAAKKDFQLRCIDKQVAAIS